MAYEKTAKKSHAPNPVSRFLAGSKFCPQLIANLTHEYNTATKAITANANRKCSLIKSINIYNSDSSPSTLAHHAGGAL